jgi:hypothetical protein
MLVGVVALLGASLISVILLGLLAHPITANAIAVIAKYFFII